MKARELMRRDLTSVELDTPVLQVIELLRQSGLPSLPVVDEEGHVAGIVAEQELIKALLPGYVDMLVSTSFLPSLNQLARRLQEIGHQPVSQFMVRQVVFVRPDDSDLHVADLLLRKGLRQVPVIDERGRLLGVIRRIDVLQGLGKAG